MKKQFRNFKKARIFAQSQKITSRKIWREYCKSGNKPEDIPSDPGRNYKKEWKGWGDFLGTGYVHKKQFRSFKDAKKFVQSLKIKSRTEWNEYYKSDKRPTDIPANPYSIYKKEWKDWGDWLGTGTIANRDKKFKSFIAAQKFVRSLNLKSATEWETYCKSGSKPDDIPTSPRRIYKKEWKSFGDWLGTGSTADQFKQYRAFASARKFVRSLNLQNFYEWNDYCKSGSKPDDIPANPLRTYKKEWTTWGNWLGTDSVSTIEKSKLWMSWSEAKILYQKIKIENNLKNMKDWKKFVKTHKLPMGLPPYPAEIYTEKRARKIMK